MSPNSPSSTNSSNLWRSFVQGTTGVKTHHTLATNEAKDDTLLSANYLEEVDKLQVSRETLVPDKGQKSTPKRIVICCDGTWQSSVSGQQNIPSNVTRLARSVALTGSVKENGKEDSICQQVVFYSAGVGTGGGVNILERGRQATFGDGLVASVIEAYNFIVMNYAPHDQLFFFGFSRGAYTARSVAGLITDIGIIQPQEMDDFPALYDLYRRHGHNDSFNFRSSKEYRQWITGVRAKVLEDWQGHEQEDHHWDQKPHNLPPEFTRAIEAVGVFDTVGSLGIPGLTWTQGATTKIARLAPWLGVDDLGFHNPSLSRYIRHAYHALALDEHRQPFTPTLWRLPLKNEQCPGCHEQPKDQLAKKFRSLLKANSKTTEEELSQAWTALIEREMADQLNGDQPELRQVWFPGGHINIGGGNPGLLYGFPFDFEQIALISFTWMCDQIKTFIQLDDEHGYKDGKYTMSTLTDREILSRNRLIHRSRHQQPFGMSWVVQRVRLGLDYSKIYEMFFKSPLYDPEDAWATRPIVDIFAPFMRAMPFFSKFRTPGEYKKDDVGNDLGQTNEEIHPSVNYRVANHATYNPRSLEGFIRSKKMASKGEKHEFLYEWKKGHVVVPEYVIKPADLIARRLAEVSAGGNKFVDALVKRAEVMLQRS
ncbi:peptidoglycan binding domain-containing protein [Colletotrichum lupini]|uniref:Peptidoglycan binding domain-containing protein n=1 Tax=Colletotrichum lupini TaxID=145971 RepID=A0A9Q8WFN2_9PEZI|nr:peptidoglycan binding domain-containing protein [Colletotrichum lupini]UQC81938.1 peptidoglycan binding domain-containing protein [Colletotrichum lupini]